MRIADRPLCRTPFQVGRVLARCYDGDVKLSATDYAAKYAQMSEAELMDVARDFDELTESAQAALQADFAKRGIPVPEPDAPEPQAMWRELLTVGRYRDLTEAEVAKSALESAGIHAELFDDNLARMNWAVTNALGGVRLQVEVQDQKSAEEILSQGIPETIAFDNDEEFNQPSCPACGSLNISFEGRSRKAALASLYVLSLPVPTGPETWVCGDCGARWEDAEVN
jgi:hypothetical protein